MAILNGVGRTAIEPGDLANFQGVPRHELVRGPARLYRFGPSRGRWWFDSSLFATLKEDFQDYAFGGAPRQKNDDGTGFLRYSLAVSWEWNKFSRVSVLTLRADEELDCFAGPAAAQPEWEKKPDGPMLGGGMLQYVIYEMDNVPAGNLSEMSTMALWRKWS